MSNIQNYFRYIDYSSNDELWQLVTTTVGMVVIAPGDPYPYRKEDHPPQYTYEWSTGRVLDEYQFLYISEGSGLFHSFKGDRFITAGSLIQLVPGERHWYRPDRDLGWKEYWIGFKGPLADIWQKHGFIRPEIEIIKLGITKSLIGLYEQAMSIAQQDACCLQQQISSLIPQMLSTIIAAENERNRGQAEDSLLSRARVMFEQHLYERFDVDSITKALNTNYYSLRDYFKEHTGMSPYQYFLQMKINKAKEMLVDGDKTVKEISYQLAFDNPYYFSRLFKKKTGVSPSKWSGANVAYDMDYWDEE